MDILEFIGSILILAALSLAVHLFGRWYKNNLKIKARLHRTIVDYRGQKIELANARFLARKDIPIAGKSSAVIGNGFDPARHVLLDDNRSAA